MKNSYRNSIKTLTRIYYDYQRERISLDGRLGMKKDKSVKKNIPERDETMLIEILKRRNDVFDMENVIFKDLAKEVHKTKLWKDFLCDVKGVGESIAAVLISEFDIHKALTVSNLWSFSGLAPGKDRKTKGKKCPYNQFLRSKLCGVLGSAFLKSNSPYREYYDNMKNRLYSENWGMDSKNPTDKKKPKAGHQHKAATRYMIKMFLKDLYIVWRTLEGLEVRKPYQEEYLEKKHIA